VSSFTVKFTVYDTNGLLKSSQVYENVVQEQIELLSKPSEKKLRKKPVVLDN